MHNFMAEAFIEARRALANGEVPVGCVFVYADHGIIARAGNAVNATKNATRHAEFLCIDQTISYCQRLGLPLRDVFAKIIVVVTVEPCIMCSAALHELEVDKVLYGCKNDRFGGKSLVDVPYGMCSKKPPTVTGGICAEEAMSLLKEFYKGENPSTLKNKCGI